MFSPGFPPKTAMVVLCLSFMSVLNMAQVEAQFPLLTIGCMLVYVYKEGNWNIPMAIFLSNMDQYRARKKFQGYILKRNNWLFRNLDIERCADILRKSSKHNEDIHNNNFNLHGIAGKWDH